MLWGSGFRRLGMRGPLESFGLEGSIRQSRSRPVAKGLDQGLCTARDGGFVHRKPKTLNLEPRLDPKAPKDHGPQNRPTHQHKPQDLRTLKEKIFH